MRELQNEKWKPGEAIPSEAELAKQHEVSRTTVRQAIGDLVSLGYLVRRQGKGTYVARDSRSSAASKLQGFAEELRSRGVNVSLKVKVIEVVDCPNKIADKLRVPRGTDVIKVARIATVDKQPIFRETSYLLLPPNASVEDVSKHSEVYNHIYGFFEHYGVKIAFGSQTISATQATYDDAKDLEIKYSEPILVVRRVTSDDTGTPVEFSEVRYPSSRYEYEVNLSRETET